MAIKTTYKDDVLNTNVNENRVFNIVDSEGNVIYEGVSFVDVSEYTQQGDSYGAAAINEENTRMMHNFGELLNTCIMTETSPTSYPHRAGELFIYNDTLYETGTNVDKGKTISTGSTWLSKKGSIYDIDFKTTLSSDNFSIAYDIWNRVCSIFGITNVWVEFYDWCDCPREIKIESGENVLTKKGLYVGDYVLFDTVPPAGVIPNGLYIALEPIEYGTNYSLSQFKQVATLEQLMSAIDGVNARIDNLDKASVGGSGKYISAISQTNGLITATAGTLSTTPTSGSAVPITSGGVYTGINSAIQALDVASVGGSGKYISAISEADGKISATATSLSTSPTKDSVFPITSGAVYSKFADIQSNFTVGHVYKDNITIAKDNIATISVSATKANYKPLGIIGYDINQASSSGYGLTQCTVIAVKLSGSDAYAQIYNRMTNASAKIKMIFYVLYAKSSS